MEFLNRKLINCFFVAIIALGVGLADGAYNFSSAESGDVFIWSMNGTTNSDSTSIFAVSDLNWDIKGVGDFDGDGKIDVLWRNDTTGDVAIWLMSGTAYSDGSVVSAVPDFDWEIKGVADFNADGKADILWQHASLGYVATWLMNGTSIVSNDIIATADDSNWNIEAIGDFSGDGQADILWRDRSLDVGEDSEEDFGTPGSGGGFLWKPISEGDGKLVILLPSSYSGLTTTTLTVYTSDGTAKTGNYKGTSNGSRETYRFNNPGADYGTNIYVVIDLSDGSRNSWFIEDGANRTES